MKIIFYGGVGNPTGSNFLVRDDNRDYLVDCGYHQGSDDDETANEEPFLYDPHKVHTLFVTHAHLDHVGRIPKLVHDGFNGRIISTKPTREMAEHMFRDTVSIMRHERGRHSFDFTNAHVDRIMKIWKTVEYHEHITLANDLDVSLRDAGHILGSALIVFSRKGKELIFTGDLGNTNSPILQETEAIPGCNYLVMESVYGDRDHEDKDQRREIVRQAIRDIDKNRGVLLIPAFSIDRTQSLLYEMNDMVESGEVPLMPVFLDSPLAIKMTDVYRKHSNLYNNEARKRVESGDDIFSFPLLRFTKDAAESREIASIKKPLIILAGSGMSEGGRITRHEASYLKDPSTILLIVGYQAEGTLGRQIANGAKQVTIDEKLVNIKADIRNVRGYSAHADHTQLISVVRSAGSSVKKVFVVLGEEESSKALKNSITREFGVESVIPRLGETVQLDI